MEKKAKTCSFCNLVVAIRSWEQMEEDYPVSFFQKFLKWFTDQQFRFQANHPKRSSFVDLLIRFLVLIVVAGIVF